MNWLRSAVGIPHEPGRVDVGVSVFDDVNKGLGFLVLGVPCNQFGGQEPGTADEIATFCSATYGVTFPMTEKVDVNGGDRHPLYARLTKTADAMGTAGDVQWNFEKFLISPDGSIVARFRRQTAPMSNEAVTAIEAILPSA